MDEDGVVRKLSAHLEKEGYLVVPQFELDKDKIDLAAFKWKNHYELECQGIECKGRLKSAYEAIVVLQDKAPRYSEWFPSLNLALYPHEEEETSRDLRTITNTYGWGLWEVGRDVHRAPSSKTGWYRLDSMKFREVRTRGAVLTTFKDIFDSKVKHTKSTYARTENDNLHYFGFFDTETRMARIGLAIRHTERLGQALSRIKKIVPHDFELEFLYAVPKLGKERRIFQKSVGKLTNDDLNFVTNPDKEPMTFTRINIKKDLWRIYDFWDRASHKRAMNSAVADLKPLFNVLREQTAS